MNSSAPRSRARRWNSSCGSISSSAAVTIAIVPRVRDVVVVDRELVAMNGRLEPARRPQAPRKPIGPAPPRMHLKRDAIDERTDVVVEVDVVVALEQPQCPADFV